MRPSNEGILYSDAQAAQAALDVMEADNDDKVAVETNDTILLASYHSWTTDPLVGGKYKVGLDGLAGGPLIAANTVIEINVILTIGAGVPTNIGGPLVQFGVTAGRFPLGFGLMLDFPPGTVTFDLQFRQPAGTPGSAQYTRNAWSIFRVK